MSEVPATIPRLAIWAAERWADQPAIIDRDRTVSFATLVERARVVAAGLIALGIEKGDTVGIWVPNCWEWVAAAIGIQNTGAVLVPLNTRLKGREVAEILRRAEARVLISVGHFLNMFYPDMLAGQALPRLDRIVVMDETLGDDARQMRWSELLASGEAGVQAVVDERIDSIQPDDLADLMFTSGTTGQPKGAIFTHAQTTMAGKVTTRISNLTERDRFATFGPFSHNASYKAGWVAGLACGCAIVITTDMSPDGVIDLIARHRVTVIPGPPTVWQGLLDAPSRAAADLSSLRQISTGGTSVPVELVRRLNRELAGVTVMTGYGLTECCGSAANTRPGDPPDIVASSSGRPVPGTEIRIADPDGQTLPAGASGEILVRNASVTLGYLNDPEATKAAIDPEGWFRTGDIGTLDEAGNVHITDRLKDMYIVGGFNCYPAEVENLLAEMPGVRQSAVIGVPDERMGQVGRAFVVRQSGAELTDADVIAWCRKNMANYKVPRSVSFLDALPMTASGKVMKQILRETPPA